MALLPLDLTAEEMKELDRAARGRLAPAVLRAVQILRGVDRSGSIDATAKVLRVAPRDVVHVIRLFREKRLGILTHQFPGRGRPAKTTPELREKILNLGREESPWRSVRQIALECGVSAGTVSAVLMRRTVGRRRLRALEKPANEGTASAPRGETVVAKSRKSRPPSASAKDALSAPGKETTAATGVGARTAEQPKGSPQAPVGSKPSEQQPVPATVQLTFL